MLRRSFSTVAVDTGASVKDIQHQMRHTQANMSLYYAKSIPKSVTHEVDRLAERLAQKVDRAHNASGDTAPSTPLKSAKAHHTHSNPTECSKGLHSAPKVYNAKLLTGNGGRDRTRTCDLLRVNKPDPFQVFYLFP